MKSEAELRQEKEAAARRRRQEEFAASLPKYQAPTPGGWRSQWTS